LPLPFAEEFLLGVEAVDVAPDATEFFATGTIVAV
jgi:hypothetical protein